MRTIIAGKRDYNNYNTLLTAIAESGLEITEVISGGAKGVDSLGARWGKENGITVKYFLPDWNKFGKSAGPIRNKTMAEAGEALIALWDYESAGTKNMIKQATDKGLQVFVYDIRGK